MSFSYLLWISSPPTSLLHRLVRHTYELHRRRTDSWKYESVITTHPCILNSPPPQIDPSKTPFRKAFPVHIPTSTYVRLTCFGWKQTLVVVVIVHERCVTYKHSHACLRAPAPWLKITRLPSTSSQPHRRRRLGFRSPCASDHGLCVSVFSKPPTISAMGTSNDECISFCLFLFFFRVHSIKNHPPIYTWPH